MKTAVVYWSATGNTEIMANAVSDGMKEAGAEVTVLEASGFNNSMVSGFDSIAFGCPAMGDEVLEEEVFEPMFAEVEGSLAGKKIGLFGSYGWGDGQWMRDWEERCKAAGAVLASESVMANYEPDEDAVAACKKLGSDLAAV